MDGSLCSIQRYLSEVGRLINLLSCLALTCSLSVYVMYVCVVHNAACMHIYICAYTWECVVREGCVLVSIVRQLNTLVLLLFLHLTSLLCQYACSMLTEET